MRATRLAPLLLAACVVGGSPDPDEATVPVEIRETCLGQIACGADPAALIGTWRLERGCAARSNPVRDQCPDSVFSAHIQAAGTVSFGTELVRFDIGSYADYAVTVPEVCAPFGCDVFSESIGFLPGCEATEDRGCRCAWSQSFDGSDLGIPYNLDGASLFTGDSRAYQVCLLGRELTLTSAPFNGDDLEMLRLVRE